jgi:hypothetical protein
VATSNRFWRSAAGRWLGSSKNIVGSLLAGGAIAAQLFFGLGPLWPLVVVASYGVGALLAPREKVDLRLGLEAGASADDLHAQLEVFRRASKQAGSRLTDDANALLRQILDALDDIVARWNDLSSAPDQQHVVGQMITDYLPTSMQAFLNLPRTFALTSRVEGKKTAHDELIEQLTILAKESDRIRTAVLSRAVDALSDQSRFLRDKFSRSDLQL